MKNLSGRDGSLLALLARIPDQLQDADERRERLLGRLSTDALEIGKAVLADEGEGRSFSRPAREAAAEIKKWARSLPKQKASASSQ
jgi:hypothetical protein